MRFPIRRVVRGVVAAALAAPVLMLSAEPYIELGSSVASAVGTASFRDRGGERQDEPVYLAGVTDLLDEAIANRANLERALRAKRPVAEYRQHLDEFRASQLGFLLKLERLAVPARLIPFHERLRTATLRQIAFYAAFVKAKTRDASIELDQMLGHPELNAATGDLQAALDHLRRLHPAIDHRLEATIEGRLVWFDVM